MIKDNNLQVVKVGASSIIDNGKVKKNILDSIAYDLNRFLDGGIHSVLVVSGAIKLGMEELNYKKQPANDDIATLTRCAGVGQPLLIENYRKALKKYDITSSQLLITYHNLNDTEEEKNIERKIKDDLNNDIVTLINYNDCIDSEGLALYDKNKKLRIRDNDMLASTIAKYINAFRIVMLTNSRSNGTVGGSITKKAAISLAKKNNIEIIIGEYNIGLYKICKKTKIIKIR